jgi:hypothetical protein
MSRVMSANDRPAAARSAKSVPVAGRSRTANRPDRKTGCCLWYGAVWKPYPLLERDAWGAVQVYDAYLSPAAHCRLLDRGLVTGITSNMFYGCYDLAASGWRHAAALYEDGTGGWQKGVKAACPRRLGAGRGG